MPTLDKNNNLFERCEVVANQIKGKRNLSQKDSATICVLAILNEVADSGKSIEELLDDGGKEWRIATRDMVQPLFTASKNFQDSYLQPSGLMPLSKTIATESEEFA